MNRFSIGFSKHSWIPKRGNFAYFDDEIPKIPFARVFDYNEHTFNPLAHLDYKGARYLAATIPLLYPQGENTLTFQRRAIKFLPLLLEGGRLDQIQGDEDTQPIIDDLLHSPVLRRVLTTSKNTFHFHPDSIMLFRINRAELGEFDALALTLLLIGQCKRQVIVQDGGFYLKDAHTYLVRENRLSTKVSHLQELPLRIRNALLSVKDKTARGALHDDAVLLARMHGLVPGTNGFNDFVDAAMA